MVASLEEWIADKCIEEERKAKKIVRAYTSLFAWQIIHAWRGEEGWREVIRHKDFHVNRYRYHRKLETLREIRRGDFLKQKLAELQTSLFYFWKNVSFMMRDFSDSQPVGNLAYATASQIPIQQQWADNVLSVSHCRLNTQKNECASGDRRLVEPRSLHSVMNNALKKARDLVSKEADLELSEQSEEHALVVEANMQWDAILRYSQQQQVHPIPAPHPHRKLQKSFSRVKEENAKSMDTELESREAGQVVEGTKGGAYRSLERTNQEDKGNRWLVNEVGWVFREKVEAMEPLEAGAIELHDHDNLRVEPDVAKVVKSITSQAKFLLRADDCHLLKTVTKNTTRDLHRMWCHDGTVSKSAIPSGPSLIRNSFMANTVILSNDPANHPDFNPAVDRIGGEHLRSFLCIPVLNRSNESLGVLVVCNYDVEGRPHKKFSLGAITAGQHLGYVAGSMLQNVMKRKACTIGIQKHKHLLGLASELGRTVGIRALGTTISKHIQGMHKPRLVLIYIVEADGRERKSLLRQIGCSDDRLARQEVFDLDMEVLIRRSMITGKWQAISDSNSEWCRSVVIPLVDKKRSKTWFPSYTEEEAEAEALGLNNSLPLFAAAREGRQKRVNVEKDYYNPAVKAVSLILERNASYDGNTDDSSFTTQMLEELMKYASFAAASINREVVTAKVVETSPLLGETSKALFDESLLKVLSEATSYEKSTKTRLSEESIWKAYHYKGVFGRLFSQQLGYSGAIKNKKHFLQTVITVNANLSGRLLHSTKHGNDDRHQSVFETPADTQGMHFGKSSQFRFHALHVSDILRETHLWKLRVQARLKSLPQGIDSQEGISNIDGCATISGRMIRSINNAVTVRIYIKASLGLSGNNRESQGEGLHRKEGQHALCITTGSLASFSNFHPTFVPCGKGICGKALEMRMGTDLRKSPMQMVNHTLHHHDPQIDLPKATNAGSNNFLLTCPMFLPCMRCPMGVVQMIRHGRKATGDGPYTPEETMALVNFSFHMAIKLSTLLFHRQITSVHDEMHWFQQTWNDKLWSNKCEARMELAYSEHES